MSVSYFINLAAIFSLHVMTCCYDAILFDVVMLFRDSLTGKHDVELWNYSVRGAVSTQPQTRYITISHISKWDMWRNYDLKIYVSSQMKQE